MCDQTNDKADLIDALQAIPWFQELPTDHFAKLIDLACLRHFDAGQELFREGDKEDCLFIVLEGRIGIELRVPGRGKVRIYTAEPMDIVGWSSITPVVRQRTAGAPRYCPAGWSAWMPKNYTKPATKITTWVISSSAAWPTLSPAACSLPACSCLTCLLTRPPRRFEMPEAHLEIGAKVTIPKTELDELLKAFHQQGYEVLGPQVRDDTIVYASLDNLADLPQGYQSRQDAGDYRLEYTGHTNYFDITPGPQSWKQYFFPPRSHLLTMLSENGKDWQAQAVAVERKPTALIGVRPCELAAIQVQDRVFLREGLTDPLYLARRESAFILAVNCMHPGGTCFCTSMGTGPSATSGFDLCLTELADVFLIEVGSEAGRMMLADLPWQPAGVFWLQNAERGLEAAAQRYGTANTQRRASARRAVK